MKKAVKEKSKKKVKKESKKTVLGRVREINRAELKEKPTKYRIAYNFIKENSGQYTRGEIVTLLHEKHGITPGTGSTVFSAFMNKKYKPSWATLEMTVDSKGKVYLK